MLLTWLHVDRYLFLGMATSSKPVELLRAVDCMRSLLLLPPCHRQLLPPSPPPLHRALLSCRRYLCLNLFLC